MWFVAYLANLFLSAAMVIVLVRTAGAVSALETAVQCAFFALFTASCFACGYQFFERDR
jgi:hypothetical protein